MPDTPDVIDRASVFKQRRLLLTFSFALAAIHALDVQLGGSVAAQGLVLTFKHPEILVVVLWFAWAWSLWRYWQYEKFYSDGPLEKARLEVSTRITEDAITKAIQNAVRVGDYESRGVKSSDSIRVSIPIGEQFTPYRYSEETWMFPNLNLYVQQPDGDISGPIQGGANCAFDRSEVVLIKRSIENELIQKHPSFADFKAPYLFALAAPIAGLYALGRYAYPFLICSHWR